MRRGDWDLVPVHQTSKPRLSSAPHNGRCCVTRSLLSFLTRATESRHPTSGMSRRARVWTLGRPRSRACPWTRALRLPWARLPILSRSSTASRCTTTATTTTTMHNKTPARGSISHCKATISRAEYSTCILLSTYRYGRRLMPSFVRSSRLHSFTVTADRYWLGFLSFFLSRGTMAFFVGA